ELRLSGRGGDGDVGADRPGARRAARLGAARGVEAAHGRHSAGASGDTGRRGRGRRVPGRARFRLHDRAGPQGRRRPGDGRLEEGVPREGRGTPNVRRTWGARRGPHSEWPQGQVAPPLLSAAVLSPLPQSTNVPVALLEYL